MTYHISKLRKYIPISSLVFLSFGLMAIIIVLVIDLSILDVLPIAEGSPNFQLVYILRTMLIVLSSGFFVLSVLQFRTLEDGQGAPDSISEIWGDWGYVFWSQDQIIKRDIISFKVKELIVCAVLLVSLFFLLVFLTYPGFFSKLGREGEPVETISAALYFLNCGLFIYSSILLSRYLNKTKLFHMMITILFAFVFFLIGMEEVSWFQRVLVIETPEFFSENLQNEMNLHNFATNEIENAYYFISFVFLIVLPFLCDKISFLRERIVFFFFMPSPFILFVSAVIVAYNYDMWNIVFTQFSFFTTLFILVYYVWSYLRQGETSLILIAVLIIVVLTQTIFIVFGENFTRNWEVTEYKELLIPLAYLMYSTEILQKLKRFRKRVADAEIRQ